MRRRRRIHSSGRHGRENAVKSAPQKTEQRRVKNLLLNREGDKSRQWLLHVHCIAMWYPCVSKVFMQNNNAVAK